MADSQSLHVLKFNAIGVWANVLFPFSHSAPNTGKVGTRSLSVTVVSTSSDLCIGLCTPDMQPMNCEPGNPIAFLSVMWNVVHNKVYFLNHPLGPGVTGAGRDVAIAYGPHSPCAPQAVYKLEVATDLSHISGFRDGELYFKISPVSKPIARALRNFTFGLALSGDCDRVQVNADFPLSVADARYMRDTVVVADSAKDAVAPEKSSKSFTSAQVRIENLVPGFQLEPKYHGAFSRRQHIDVNEDYPKLKKIHSDPDVYEIEDFLTAAECQLLMVSLLEVVCLL